MLKYCLKCNVEIATNRNYCEEHAQQVKKERKRQYYLTHKERDRDKRRTISKRYRDKHKSDIARKEREYKLNHKKEIRVQKQQYYMKNKERIISLVVNNPNRPLFALKRYRQNRFLHNFKSRFRKCLKGSNSTTRFPHKLPYTFQQLKEHLSNTMPNGYTWDDYDSGSLHVDHIIPVSAFRTEDPSDLEFYKCWSLENLRLLPAKENIKKGAKLISQFQRLLPLKMAV